MEIVSAADLQPLNTLSVPATAAHYCRIDSAADVPEAVAYSERRGLPRLVLGGGSNIVLSGDFAGLVMHLLIAGIEPEIKGSAVRLRVGAGENWDALVRHCLSRDWYGLENLIAIPGHVGAAPIQNIGAYGVELSSVLDSVEGWHLPSGEFRRLSRDDCQLAYRDSIFKHALRDAFVITHVNLCLSTEPRVNTGYQALAAALPADREPTPQLVADTVAAVRASKLPDPAHTPNVGSFFKNPIVSAARHEALRAEHPALPAWPMADGRTKLAAGWLVEQTGWKGKRRGAVGVHERQSLVLVNYQQASGGEVLALAEDIRRDVLKQFGVALEIEPRVY